MGDYHEALEAKQRALPSLIRTANDVYARYGTLINRYRGGMPPGLLAAIIVLESSGNPNAVGDSSLGERGLLQVATQTAIDFGVSPSVRLSAEGNIALGSLEYNVEAARLSLRYPQIIPGTLDQYLCARGVFVFGRAGMRKLLDNAQPLRAGHAFDSVLSYLDRTGGIALGGSSAEKVWYRAHMIALTKQIGQATGSMWASRPVVPPAPVGVVWRIPADVKEALKVSYLPMILFAGALFALVRMGA